VIGALRINVKIIADPSKPIAGPVKKKIAPPIITAIPSITISTKFNDLTFSAEGIEEPVFSNPEFDNV
jgi:hypothetical protein